MKGSNKLQECLNNCDRVINELKPLLRDLDGLIDAEQSAELAHGGWYEADISRVFEQETWETAKGHIQGYINNELG